METEAADWGGAAGEEGGGGGPAVEVGEVDVEVRDGFPAAPPWSGEDGGADHVAGWEAGEDGGLELRWEGVHGAHRSWWRRRRVAETTGLAREQHLGGG